MKIIRFLVVVFALSLAQTIRAQITDQQAINYVKTTWEITDLTDDVISQTLNTSYSGIPYKDYVSYFVVAPSVLSPLSTGDYKTAGKNAADFAVDQSISYLLKQAGLSGVFAPARLAAWPIENSLNSFYEAVAYASFKKQMGLYFEAREFNSYSAIVNLQPSDLLDGVTITKSDDGWLYKKLSYLYGAVPNYTPTQFFEYAELMWQADQARANYNADEGTLKSAFRAAAAPQKPVITQQPQDAVIASGQNAALAVAATGAGPFQYVWELNGVPFAGPYGATFNASVAGQYAVTVYDTNTLSTRSRIATLTVNYGEPTAITAPAANAMYSGSLTVRATANNATRIEFYLDGYRQYTDSSTPFAWTWDTTTSANGTHALTAKAYNGTTPLGSSAVVGVTVNNITSPPNTTPSITSVLPSTLTGLPLPQTQLLRVIGSGFTASSTLLFNGSIASDPARLTLINANEIDYLIRTDTNAASWTVKVINGAQQSNLGYFTVVAPTPNTGSLTVNLSPAGAVSAGAQWRVDGGSYRNSGDTAIGLTPGTRTISFKSVSGYTKPSDKSVSITAAANTTTTGDYSADAPITYTLDIFATHGHIVARPDLNEYPAGAEVQLTAYPDAGYVIGNWSGSVGGSARTVYVTMSKNKSVTANFIVDTSYADIRVNISPAAAVAEGAAWKVFGQVSASNWQPSGDNFPSIPPGDYTVFFKPIEGWATPADIRLHLPGGPTTVTNGTYIEIPGVVVTTIEPAAAVTAGARWRLDGGAWLESSVNVPGVAPGTHQVEFQAIASWSSPASQQITVPRGGTVIRTGQYAPPPGFALVTAVSPKTSPLSGGTIVTIEGVNFQTNATVSFGGIAATSVSVQSATKMLVTAPPRASYGSVNISIQTGGQTINLPNGFSYLNPLGSNIELVGQIGGNVEAVAVAGNMVCYGEGTSLVVSDFSNSAAPVERGRIVLPAVIRDMVIVSNTAFVAADSAGLYAVDISTPTAPAIVGFFDTEGGACGVTVSGGLAYVADGYEGLQILDVTNTAAIVRRGHVDTAGYTRRVSVGTVANKQYAFVAESDLAMRVIDVTTPSALVEVTNVPTQGGGITDVKLLGTTLYVSDWSAGVKIFNASNPTNLVQTGSRGNVGGGAFIDVIGNRLYTCSGTLRVADLTVSPNPTNLGSFYVAPFCKKLVVSSGLAFAAMGRDGLKVVAASNPASMSLRSSLQTLSDVEDVWVTGSTAFLGNDTGLHSIDVSSPTHPVRVATLAGDRVTDIVVADGKATLVNYGDEVVRIANVLNPLSPSLLGTYTNVEAWNVALMGGTPILAAATKDAAHRPKLDVLNISTPSNPQSTGSLLLDTSNGIASAIAVVGNWAFVGRPEKALDVVSLANPASPQKVGSVPTPNFYRDLAVSEDGNFVYVTGLGIQVIDVTVKTAPVLGQLIDPPQTIGISSGAIRVVGSRLFVEEGGFIFVFDISSPASPQMLGYYDIPGSGYGISVAGDLIYVADYQAGMSILRLNDVGKPTVAITGPTTNPQLQTNSSPLSLNGAASDDQAVARVVWQNDRGGSGEAQGTNSWSISGIILAPGQNIINVTAFDATGNSGNDTVTVTYDSPKQDQTITFPALTGKTFGDALITLTATASSSLPVNFSILSGLATLSNNVLTLTGAGSVTVRASQAGDANFNAAPSVDRLFAIAKSEQIIAFAPLEEKSLDDLPFTLNATASSGLPVAFSIQSGPAAINNNSLTITGAGAVFVRASQPGNSNYNAALEVERSFVVAKLPQFIIFNSLSRQLVDDAPFPLTASASSGLPVDFSVLSGPAIVSGNILTMTGEGLVVLRAAQSGDATNAPAPNVDQVLIIAPGNNIITDFQRLANGMFTFRFYGEPGTNYVVQGSTNLMNWSALATNQVSGLGYLEFTDTSATNYNKRFYRIAPLSALTPNSPVLSLALVGNSVVVSWATNDDGFTLETATNLPPTGWTSNSTLPAVVNGRFTVTNAVVGAEKLFRLKK